MFYLSSNWLYSVIHDKLKCYLLTYYPFNKIINEKDSMLSKNVLPFSSSDTWAKKKKKTHASFIQIRKIILLHNNLEKKRRKINKTYYSIFLSFRRNKVKKKKKHWFECAYFIVLRATTMKWLWIIFVFREQYFLGFL